jgi:caffeoyl-CoA O-methyltransferase
MEKDVAAANDPEISRYLAKTFHPEDEILREVRERSAREGLPEIQVGALDGLHLQVLARAIGARKAVEIGTLGGYSGINLLRGMSPGGTLDSFELNEHHAEVARESFRRAGFAERARVHVGPALSRLGAIERDGPFDLVFIDADKESYPAYLQWAERNLRVGGILLGDNTLAFGMIAKENLEKEDADDARTVRALRDFNTRAASGRFLGTMLPTGEGLTFAVKIS